MASVKEFLSLMRQRAWSYWLAIALLVFSTVLFLAIPPIIGFFIEALSRGETGKALTLAAAMAAIMMIQNITMALYGYVLARVAEALGNQLRQNFFDNILAHDIDKLAAKRSGALASEFSSDLGVIQMGLSDTFITLLRHILFTVGALSAMLFVNWQLGLVTLTSVAVVGIVVFLFVRMIGRLTLSVQNARADAVAHFVESIGNALVIRAYGREKWFSDKFGGRLGETFRLINKQNAILAIVNPVSLFLFSLAVLAILTFGIQQIGQGTLTAANLIAFVTYAIILTASVSQIGVMAGRLRQSAILFEKHADFLKPRGDEVENRSDVSLMEEGPIGIKLRNVSFTYSGASQPALDAIGCDVPQGSLTGLVGQSGSGKSTLVSIICGLFRPTKGTISFDGGRWPLGPSEMAIVPQNPFLFSGSILENITMGRPEIDLERVVEAAKQVRMHDFIMSLPGGYDYDLNESGRNFSRGQQQRLALARALVGSPRLLILDEATASLDRANEQAVKDALMDLRGKVTVLVVAHHGQLLDDLDHVIMLDNGRISEAEGEAAQMTMEA